MQNKITADTLVFDFNGTLINDRDVCLHLLNKMLTSRSHSPITLERYLSIFTFPIIDYYRKAGFRFAPEGSDDFVDLAQVFDREYQQRFPEIPLFDDVTATLNHYRGKKRLLVLSATKQDSLERQLSYLNLLPYFDYVVGIKTIYAPSKIEEAKAFFSSHPFDPNKTVFIGDTLHDDEVAVALKSHSILVTRGHQSLARIEAHKSELSAPSLRACWDLIA